MKKLFGILNPLRMPTPATLHRQHLESAQRELLEQQRLAEYHTGMVEVLKKRVRRLTQAES